MTCEHEERFPRIETSPTLFGGSGCPACGETIKRYVHFERHPGELSQMVFWIARFSDVTITDEGTEWFADKATRTEIPDDLARLRKLPEACFVKSPRGGWDWVIASRTDEGGDRRGNVATKRQAMAILRYLLDAPDIGARHGNWDLDALLACWLQAEQAWRDSFGTRADQLLERMANLTGESRTDLVAPILECGCEGDAGTRADVEGDNSRHCPRHGQMRKIVGTKTIRSTAHCPDPGCRGELEVALTGKVVFCGDCDYERDATREEIQTRNATNLATA